jgi:hypothetical protein
MATILSNIGTALIGVMSAVFGAVIGYYFNQQLSLRNARKDIIFKRKLEYFENLAETMEINLKMYKNASVSIKLKSSKKNVANILREMKENRKNFKIMASPLYFNVRSISRKIIDFVNAEKEIFTKFQNLEKKRPTSQDFKDIEEKINFLRDNANKILDEMRSEIKEDFKIKL